MKNPPSNIKISVIIPVYNTKEYLRACINSILNQTLTELEILIVDDGSEDGCWEIIEEYTQQHINIRAFRQHHNRQGAARNLALKYARGEFVAFVDSDDTIPQKAYQTMYELARESGTDMVVGILGSFNGKKQWVGVPVHQNKFTKIIKKTNIFEFPELLSDGSACNKIIRRSCIEKYQIRFSEKTSGEDLDFIARIYLRVKKISILPEVVYNYRARPNASTKRISVSFFRDRVLITQHLKTYYEAHQGSEIFPYLCRSEVRKLVHNRFARVLNELAYDKQLEIFKHIHSLAQQLSLDDILKTNDFPRVGQIRIIFLKFKEYDALIAHEQHPSTLRSQLLIKNDDCKSLLSKVDSTKDTNYNFWIKKAVSFFKSVEQKIRYKILKGNWRELKQFGLIKYLFLSLIFKKNKTDSNIWLMDERISQTAEDNAFHLFAYLRKQYPELQVYYIISRFSPHKKKVEAFGNVVDLFSWKHLYLLHKSKVLLSTDSFKSLAYPHEILPRFRKNTHNVFLQHGVAGNKTMTYYKENYPLISQVITSNENEKRFFTDTYHFKADEVTITGLARFDKLPLKKKDSPSQKILIASTWRKWLKSNKNLQTTKYYSAWNHLITSNRFIDLLERYGIDCYFQPHFNMMKFIDEFEGKSSRIHIIGDQTHSLQEYIIGCDLLITDYSSIMYDFYFQEKPVIGYMFDRDEWESQPDGPPHLDFDRELPADITYTVDEVLKKSADYFETNFEIKPTTKSRITPFFKYRDHKNCERIFKSVCRAQAENKSGK